MESAPEIKLWKAVLLSGIKDPHWVRRVSKDVGGFDWICNLIEQDPMQARKVLISRGLI